MVVKWLGDGLTMSIPRFESYGHTLGLSIKIYMTISIIGSLSNDNADGNENVISNYKSAYF